MYRPLAAAVIAAVAAALVLALTSCPSRLGASSCGPRRTGAPEDVAVLRALKRAYAPLLDACMRRQGWCRRLARGDAFRFRCAGLVVGTDFMPQLDEGAYLLQTVLPPEASLDEVDRLNHRVEDVLRQVPEVEDVIRRTGRSERTEDPMPHTVSDVLVVLKASRNRSSEAIEDDMRARTLKLPGVSVLFTTPLGMRIDEGLGGTPADISFKVFGPDLGKLTELSDSVRAVMASVRGVTDLRVEQATGLPQLRIAVNRQASARVGLAPGDVIRAIRIGLVGQLVSDVWLGQRRFDLIVRLSDERRADINAIRSLLVDGHDGTKIPLGQLAEIEQTSGPGAIRRESGSRRVAVEATVSGRDLGSTAAEIRSESRSEV